MSVTGYTFKYVGAASPDDEQYLEIAHGGMTTTWTPESPMMFELVAPYTAEGELGGCGNGSFEFTWDLAAGKIVLYSGQSGTGEGGLNVTTLANISESEMYAFFTAVSQFHERDDDSDTDADDAAE